MANELAIQPVRKERISQRIALEICRMIRDGNLAAGDSLPPERELAGQLGVSRASLREALRGLEIAGIVETRHGGGTTVRSFSAFGTESPLAMIFEASHDSMSDLWEMRRIVEPALAARAAVRARPEGIVELREMLERHRGPYMIAGDGEMRRKMDREFHGAIARLTDNQAAEQVIQLLNTLVHNGYLAQRKFILDRRKRAFRSHFSIYEAIRDRDSQEAQNRMLDHLQEVEEYIFEEFIDGRNEDELARTDVTSSDS